MFSSNIKKFQETETPDKKFLIFQETRTLKKLLKFREMKLCSPPREQSLILQETEAPKNVSYFLLF